MGLDARGCLPFRGTSLPPAGALLPGKRPGLRTRALCRSMPKKAKTFDGLRWWTLWELETTDERFAPADLPVLVRALVELGPPERPVAVGV